MYCEKNVLDISPFCDAQLTTVLQQKSPLPFANKFNKVKVPAISATNQETSSHNNRIL